MLGAFYPHRMKYFYSETSLRRTKGNVYIPTGMCQKTWKWTSGPVTCEETDRKVSKRNILAWVNKFVSSSEIIKFYSFFYSFFFFSEIIAKPLQHPCLKEAAEPVMSYQEATSCHSNSFSWQRMKTLKVGNNWQRGSPSQLEFELELNFLCLDGRYNTRFHQMRVTVTTSSLTNQLAVPVSLFWHRSESTSSTQARQNPNNLVSISFSL